MIYASTVMNMPYSRYSHDKSELSHPTVQRNQRYVPTGFPPKLRMNSLSGWRLKGSPTSMNRMCLHPIDFACCSAVHTVMAYVRFMCSLLLAARYHR